MLGACGVPAALFEARGDGTSIRESWRRFVMGSVEPLLKMVARGVLDQAGNGRVVRPTGPLGA